MLAPREKLSSILASTRGLLQLPVRRDGRGGTYYTATKEPISDEGLQVVEGRAHGDGPTLVGRFRVAPVSRTLSKASRLSSIAPLAKIQVTW